jgi:hypothetical protein
VLHQYCLHRWVGLAQCVSVALAPGAGAAVVDAVTLASPSAGGDVLTGAGCALTYVFLRYQPVAACCWSEVVEQHVGVPAGGLWACLIQDMQLTAPVGSCAHQNLGASGLPGLRLGCCCHHGQQAAVVCTWEHGEVPVGLTLLWLVMSLWHRGLRVCPC